MKVKYDFNHETGIFQCTLFYKNEEFIGEAKCHPHDRAFMSEVTGGFIAESRAYIKYYQFKKKYELKPALAALRHVVNCIPKDAKSHEAKILYRNLNSKEKELKELEDTLAESQFVLRRYIEIKNEILARRGSTTQEKN